MSAALLIALDRQHSGKPNRLDDMGAWGDLDHNGKPDIAENEAMWTAQYLWAAELALRRLGHQVIPISDGLYSARHDRANAYGCDVYIAAHLNSLTGKLRRGGGGNYGSVFYDHRSAKGNGKDLAKNIAAKLQAACPEITGGVKAVRSQPTGWTRRAFSTIVGLDVPIGICFEPLFLDHADHRPLFTAEGMSLIGNALAAGIHAWAQTRRTA